jgi:hypothetical protein
MDTLEFDEDGSELFQDAAFVQALAIADQPATPKPVNKSVVAIAHSGDAIFEDATFAQALAHAESQLYTPKKPDPDESFTTEDEDFDQAGLDDEQLMVALDSLSSGKDTGTALDDNEIQRERAAVLEELATVNKNRPLAVKFTPWTKVPQMGEDEFSDPDFEDPDILAALEDAERCALPSIAPSVKESNSNTIQISRAELDAIKRNAFAAGQANHHRLWRRKYIFELMKLPAGTTPSIAPANGSLTHLPCRTSVDDILLRPQRHQSGYNWWEHHRNAGSKGSI